jgi:L-malate glycosyltransferase
VKTNVLQLVPSFHQGGSERQALQLARLLDEDGTYNVKLACLEKNGVLLDDDVTARFDEIPDFPLTSFYDTNMAKQIRRFARYLRANRIDLVQTHDFYTNIFGMIGARIARVPVRIAAKRETGMRSGAQRFIERRAFAAADAVVVNSEIVKNYLASSGVPGGKLEVIYNGIDHGRFNGLSTDRETLLHEFGLPADRDLTFVTIVANLRSSVKNQEMFLRAAKRIAEKNVDTRFVIAGEGERMRLITSMARDLDIADRVFFLGRCSRVPDLLAISDICSLTSDSEGFSNSIVEYMAAGKPVVATDVGGAAEAVVENETGFLIPSDDDEALADRIGRLIDDRSLRVRLGRAGKQRVAERFSVTNRLMKTLAIYERELSRAGTSRA